ncbi:MAG: PAS domain-containing protein [Rhodospirillales bacterium]|nr:PAS domain-containing protein [Rhodospirillales bacterium]
MTDRPDFKEPKLASLWDYWAARKAARPYPDRADFDPVDMRPWLGHLMLVELVDGRWVYRLYGTYFVETFRREMTGKGIDELPAEQARLLQAEYDSVRDSGAPVVRTYSAQFDFGTLDGRQSWQLDQTWERVCFPLSDAAAGHGDQVRLVLVAAYLVGGHAA